MQTSRDQGVYLDIRIQTRPQRSNLLKRLFNGRHDPYICCGLHGLPFLLKAMLDDHVVHFASIVLVIHKVTLVARLDIRDVGAEDNQVKGWLALALCCAVNRLEKVDSL